jgi:hypothetical protein
MKTTNNIILDSKIRSSENQDLIDLSTEKLDFTYISHLPEKTRMISQGQILETPTRTLWLIPFQSYYKNYCCFDS